MLQINRRKRMYINNLDSRPWIPGLGYAIIGNTFANDLSTLTQVTLSRGALDDPAAAAFSPSVAVGPAASLRLPPGFGEVLMAALRMDPPPPPLDGLASLVSVAEKAVGSTGGEVATRRKSAMQI